MKRFGALISLLTVWFVSLLLASPLAVFSVLDAFEPIESIVLYEMCVENPELGTQRRAYSLASIVFQYLLPVVIVSVAHVRISHKLRSRMVSLQQRNAASSSVADSSTSARRQRRRQELQSTSTMAAEAGARGTVSVSSAAAVRFHDGGRGRCSRHGERAADRRSGREASTGAAAEIQDEPSAGHDRRSVRSQLAATQRLQHRRRLRQQADAEIRQTGI